jgi:hypothetical protein
MSMLRRIVLQEVPCQVVCDGAGMAACPTLAPGDYRSAAEGFTRVVELPAERGDRLTTAQTFS